MNGKTKMTLYALAFGAAVAGAGEANATDEQAFYEPGDAKTLFLYVLETGKKGDYAYKSKEYGVFREQDVSDPYFRLELKVPDDNGKEEPLEFGAALGLGGDRSYLGLALSDGMRFTDYGPDGIADLVRVSIDSPIEIPTPEQQRIYQEKANKALKYINKEK